MELPDFIIIGAQRSGTTSLHNWLGAHPDVADVEEPRREVGLKSVYGTVAKNRPPVDDKFRAGVDEVSVIYCTKCGKVQGFDERERV